MSALLVTGCTDSETEPNEGSALEFDVDDLDEFGLAIELSRRSSRAVIFVQEGAEAPGQGTRKRPYSSLELVEANSGPGDAIVVLDADDCLDGGIALQEGQALLGGTRVRCDDEGCEVSAARSEICNTNDTDPRYEGDAIRLADGAIVAGIHITEATRFGIYGMNVDDVTIAHNLIENAVSTDVPARNFLACDLEVREDFVDDGVAILKMPTDELGCWTWPAAFPGSILSDDRSSQLFFSNVAAAAIGFLANEGDKSARVLRTVITDFTAGNVTGSEPGPFGFAEGANGLLLSTDEDARFELDVSRLTIGNSPGVTRVADCTYAAIFTQHHDTSVSTVNVRNSLIREIGGCDGINSHIGFLPGVMSGDDPSLLVRIQDDNVADADITAADDPDLGPKHASTLTLNLNRMHVINPFDPIIEGTQENPSGQDPDNPANQFTDAFEPTMAEGAGSTFILRVRNSTMSQNAGNGWEMRYGSDSIESITTPNLADVRATMTDNCVFDNARSDDLFRNGTDDAPNFGRDDIIGRDFHQVHLFLPEDPSFVIDARRNYWGNDSGLRFDTDAEITQIIAIENDTLAPGSSSSYADQDGLFEVFDASNPRTDADRCFELPD